MSLAKSLSLHHYLAPAHSARIVAIAGRPYVDALRHGLSHETRAALRVEEPLTGLMIGERLAWLNKALLHLNGLGKDAPTITITP